MVRETRKKWSELAARWARSGLTANKFAAEAKINAGTLQYYKWLIGRDSRVPRTRRPRPTGVGNAPAGVQPAQRSVPPTRYSDILGQNAAVDHGKGTMPETCPGVLTY